MTGLPDALDARAPPDHTQPLDDIDGLRARFTGHADRLAALEGSPPVDRDRTLFGDLLSSAARSAHLSEWTARVQDDSAYGVRLRVAGGGTPPRRYDWRSTRRHRAAASPRGLYVGAGLSTLTRVVQYSPARTTGMVATPWDGPVVIPAGAHAVALLALTPASGPLHLDAIPVRPYLWQGAITDRTSGLLPTTLDGTGLTATDNAGYLAWISLA